MAAAEYHLVIVANVCGDFVRITSANLSYRDCKSNARVIAFELMFKKLGLIPKPVKAHIPS